MMVNIFRWKQCSKQKKKVETKQWDTPLYGKTIDLFRKIFKKMMILPIPSNR